MNAVSHKPIITPPSPFELFVFRQSITSITSLFSTWPPDLIFTLGKVNFRLGLLVRWYASTAWDMDSFFSNWLSSASEFRHALRSSDALVVGPAVLRYFNRNPPSDEELYVFVRNDGLGAIATCVESQGYKFLPQESQYNALSETLESLRDYLTSAARRGVRGIPRIVSVLCFARILGSWPSTIRLRHIRVVVTRADPLTSVLSFSRCKFE